MRYVVVFSLVAAYLASLAVALGGWGYALLWPALSFGLFAAAYAGGWPGLLGKRPDGRLAAWAYLLFGPMFALFWSLWHLHRLLDRTPALHEVAPGVWLSRRPLAREIPEGVRLVVDLTAEFPAACGVTAGRDYLLLPTLDGCAPPEPAFLALVARLADYPQPLLIHCAAGRGRSATVAAAVLVARAVARDAGHAEEVLRQVRRGVRLNPEQRRLLARYTTALGERPGV